ncbi:hypothetical protein VTO42DRAFT_3922 [Malbranchea cinnamomea]
MPRTLPWQVKSESREGSAVPSSRPHVKTPKSRSLTATESDADSKPTARRRPRSPSTSPAPEPPSEEYMIEGFDGDDIYVMVEDEFLATAQTFTRHLHQEEYERRKRIAKIKNATAICKLARPTDPRAKMSAERQTYLKAQEASVRQKAALDRMTHGLERSRVDSEIEDVDEGTDDDRDDDPWVGTQLQTLMTSPRRPRSLIGLQGVKSNTRAAHGYSNRCARRERSSIPLAENHEDSRKKPQQPVVTVEETSSGEDDDDLGSSSKWTDAAPKRPNPLARASAFTVPAPSTKSVDLVPESSELSRKSNVDESIRTSRASSTSSKRLSTTTTTTTARPTYLDRMSKLLDDFDEEFEATIKREPTFQNKGSCKPSPLTSSSARSADEGDDDKSKKDRLNEIPMFL